MQDEIFEQREMLIIFGQNIKVSRERKGIGITQLAKLCAYDRTCIAKLERGEQNLEYLTAIKLAKVLDVSFAELFSRNYLIQLENEGVDAYREDDYLNVFIENFQRRRFISGYPQMRVYIVTGVGEATISRIVQRKNVNPTIGTLGAMAYAVQTDMSELFKRS